LDLLVLWVGVPTKARSQSVSGQELSPTMHLFGHNLDHDYYFELIREPLTEDGFRQDLHPSRQLSLAR
jgi:hypothetical protein